MWCATARQRQPLEARAAWARAKRGATRTLVQVGVDVDADALQIAASNAAQFEDVHIDLLLADVAQLPRRLHADTVVTCAHAVACRVSCS